MGYSIVILGAGNLATHLSLAISASNYSISQIYSRTQLSAAKLSSRLNCSYTTDPDKIVSDADIYFIALKDNVYHKVLPFADFGNKLLVHCSGSMPLSAISKYSSNIGVFYPLQTFSKERSINFREIPVFIEANSKTNEDILLNMASGISDSVSLLGSEDRLFLHIAAVYACNFVNYFYTIAANILGSKDISFDVLKPLIKETAMKIFELAPEKAQTGPAVRFDSPTISKHLKALEDFSEYEGLYELISNYIFKYYNKKSECL